MVYELEKKYVGSKLTLSDCCAPESAMMSVLSNETYKLKFTQNFDKSGRNHTCWPWQGLPALHKF